MMDDITGSADESGYGSETGEFTKSLARLNLQDNGQRNWQEESKMYLDANFPDWKNPQMAYILSTVPKPTGQTTSKGPAEEHLLFELIEQFGQKYPQPMFVVHSYDFAALIENAEKGYCRREWVKGECDFVIIHRHFGLLFIEVKAKETTRKAYESALEQISKVKKAVVSYCKKIFQGSNRKAIEIEIFQYPGFVAMPNCSKQESFDCGLFREDCQDVESFKKWWDQKVVCRDEGIHQDIYEALMVRLVPIYCVPPTLNIQIQKTHHQITVFYTPKQLDLMLQSCPKQWITGPAGCGKTVLLIQKVKEVISSIMTNDHRHHERVLVLCYNRPLSVYLRNEISDWFKHNYKLPLHPKMCTIKTYFSFFKEDGGFTTFNPDLIRDYIERKYRLESPNDEAKFHHIFVDEGQDFPGNWPEKLDKFLKEEDPYQEDDIQYYFWVMFDSNQRVQFDGRQDLLCRLKQAFRMKIVLRNTEKIFVESKKYFVGLFNENIKLGHKEVGLNVKFDDGLCDDKSNGVDVLTKHIDSLLREKVGNQDVVILTRDQTARDFLMEELLDHYPSFNIETAEDRLCSKNNVIAIESIRRFKGLESKVVIVYDPEYSGMRREGPTKARELLYIAMSRCFCYLVVVSTMEGCRVIQTGELLSATLAKAAPSRMKVVEHSAKSMADIEATHRHTERSTRFNEFGKTSMNTRYESGPPERKRFKDHDEDEEQDPETIESAVNVTEMEEKQAQQLYDRTRPVQDRPVNVEGGDIFEPGDQHITDKIREQKFPVLTKCVKTNLLFAACKESISEEQVKACVKKIEYHYYRKHKHKHNPRDYTKELRTLKREIERKNNEKKIHERVRSSLQ